MLLGLKAGYSAENAFRSAYEEMVFLFGHKSLIAAELQRISRGLENHIPVEDLVQEMAFRTESVEAEEFAEIFAIAKRSGGNLAEILSRTITVIQGKLDVEAEIAVLISGKRMEQNVMSLVPFGIILYIGLTSEGYFDPMYHNLMGICVMSACLMLYALGIILADRITEIRV